MNLQKGFLLISGILFVCLNTVENTLRLNTIENTLQRRAFQDVEVRELEISSDTAFRYAHVLVKSVMINQKASDQEVTFQMKLPKEAFITRFTILTENRTIEAVIKEKKKAQKVYDKAKEDNVTAGLVSQQSISDDLDLDIFKIEVNVAKNAQVEFRLEYEELLHRHAAKYSQKLYIDSDHVIPKLDVKCRFKEKQKFKYLSYKTPYHKQRVVIDEASVREDGYYVKTVDWNPSDTDQKKETIGLDAPFEVEYELELENNGGMIFFNNEGDFVYMFSVPCEESKIMTKQIVFVIDISGSMNGNPIIQVRQAMSAILLHLRRNDYFNIIIFDHVTAKWKMGFQRANPENVNAAKLFVLKYVEASGDTNINDALLDAIDLFRSSESDERYGQIIVFLTDGTPTYGVKNTSAIRKTVRERNNVREGYLKSTINTIAFGLNADIEFLKRIAIENAGSLTIIKEIESTVAEGELISTYKNIENPFYKNLIFSFEVDNVVLPENDITQSQLLLYDCGSEIVISGQALPGEEVYPTVKVVGAQNDIVFNTVPTVLILDSESEILTRLAAYQWVKQLLKEADITLDADEKETANKRALELALQYGFVTPLTSLVVADHVPTESGETMHRLERGPTLRSRGREIKHSARVPVLQYDRKKIFRATSGHSRSHSDKLILSFDLFIILFVTSKCLMSL